MSTNKREAFLASLKDSISQSIHTDVVELEGVTGPAKAAAIVDVYQNSKRPMLVICPDEEDVRNLEHDILFYLGANDDDANFIGDRRVVKLLPDDLSPYESRKFIPSRARQMELLAGLYALSQPFRPAITLTTTWAMMRRYIPKRILERQTEYLLAGVDIDRDELLLKLAHGGYRNAPIVEDPGAFSSRGFIVDVFSPLYSYPLRLEFFGDTLESIRLFDPVNQKSKQELEEAYLIPVREIVLAEDTRKRGAKNILKLAKEHEAYDRQTQNMLLDLEEGLYSTDLDPYMPVFYEEQSPFFAYISSNTHVFLDKPNEIYTLLSNNEGRMFKQWEERQNDADLTLEPEQYIMSKDDCLKRLSTSPRILAHELNIQSGSFSETKRFHWEDHDSLKQEILNRRGRVEILEPLIRRFRRWMEEGYLVFLVANTHQQLERLVKLVEPHQVKCVLWEDSFPEVFRKLEDFRAPQINCLVGGLKSGQIWSAEKIVFLCESEIFGERRKQVKKKAAFDKEAFLTSLDEISEGDFIVHVEFGIGVYKGLKHFETGAAKGDFLHIQYLGGDKLYLPVTRLEKVQKYSGAESNIPNLDRLGGTRWARMKGKVKAAIREMAEELLKLYAKRQMAKGFAFSKPDDYYAEFEASFPYEETRDQQQAIDDTLKDMQKVRPMDRLVCGDVGFGKTEVAMRAAFKAVVDNKQVAILVPTTVLAVQHGESFTERFKDYPVHIETISRFKSAKEQKLILDSVKRGKVDILIGTHRILSKDVEFPRLGLLAIDEEQRFGVAHKERVKEMKESVDVLTLTATPIPRTLNMALSGVRNISIIRTPPMDRLSIRTYVSKFEEETIAEAIHSELSRGGQVYFVHNRVGSIDAMGTMIKRLVPKARISVAHGQMSEHQLEKVMLQFVKRETNVLVTTTIIESGIDISSVNTIIVNRADAFGLSQLYQLRGRVGRGKERAYCYLLVPSPSTLTKDAQKRLAALVRFTELGSGFRIASHDMEIRGAGNLLGKQQSGHIAAIGIDLYFELIEEAIAELKGQKVSNQVEPQINLFLPAFVPNSYITDAALRLHFYKRLSSAKNMEAVYDISEEMEDRFGRFPEEVNNLVHAIEMKVLLRLINAEGIDLSPKRVAINLGEHCNLAPDVAIDLATKGKAPFQLTPDMRLVRTLLAHEMEDPIGAAKNILHKLIDYDNSSREGFN